METKSGSGKAEVKKESVQGASESADLSTDHRSGKRLLIEGYPIEGLSIAGHETCVILPSLKLAFDIGRCPQRAISQDFLFISHAHMDHIGGVAMYVASRGLFSLKPPTVIVPKCVKEDVERLFEVHRKMDNSELKHNLIGMDVGEEIYVRRDVKVRAFRTYHVIPSQGYVVYSVKEKLKQEYVGLPGNKIRDLKLSGVEITYTTTTPEVAFTGDTTSDFIHDENNADVLRAKILIMECLKKKQLEVKNIISCAKLAAGVSVFEGQHFKLPGRNTVLNGSTFVDDKVTVEHAKEYGHTHLCEIVGCADSFANKAILLIHFSARHKREEIEAAISALGPPLAGRVFALTEGF